MIDHDAKPGPLWRCQICGSEDLREIIDLGHQPLCDALLSSLDEPEVTYPLRLNQCRECSLAQLSYVVPATDVYPATYPYKAGISWPVVAAHKAMAERIVARFGKGLVVDIGSNDGTLLGQFFAAGCPVMGVEPTDIADVASVPTLKAFFTEEVALEIAQTVDKAHVITMTNVFAHMADLGEVMRGIRWLLADDGVLVIENHYLMDVLERNQFDTIYHEHVRTYTLQSLMRLFEQYGMRVFDVERVPRYGGNIRVYVDRYVRDVTGAVAFVYGDERNLNTDEAWISFADRVYRERDSFMSFIRSRDVVGCSAPGRASTLLNFYGVRHDMMNWTGEIKGSMKIGKWLPGCHVKVVSNQKIIEDQPEHVALLAWHYADEIKARLKGEGYKGKFIMPLPTFQVLE